jgi:ATP-grasp domain-containing protein
MGGEVVAGSAYEADGRSSLPADPRGEPWAYASSIAERLEAPQPIYVLDVCEADGGLALLELNPFGGADLYACDLALPRFGRQVGHAARAALRR